MTQIDLKSLIPIRKLLIFGVLSLLTSTNVFAQYTLSGKLVSETNTKLEFASVQLLRPDSTVISATTSNIEGGFTIKNVRAGSYFLKFYYLGYKSLPVGGIK
jgi:hypothetical protein